jgi:hypothetical protein
VAGAAPGATEKISYGMPTFKTRGTARSSASSASGPWTGDIHHFGSTTTGNPTEYETFTIENKGTETLTISAPSWYPTVPADFDLDTTGLDTTIEADATPTTAFTVRFDPSSAGDKDATLHIASDDDDEDPCLIRVDGTGVVPTPEIDVRDGSDNDLPDSTGSYAFGPVAADGEGMMVVGPRERAATVRIDNNDSDDSEGTYTFSVNGPGMPVDEMWFPPTRGLPWESGPFIDGVVDRNPSGDDELGSNNAFRLTYENGTNPAVAFQGLHDPSASFTDL